MGRPKWCRSPSRQGSGQYGQPSKSVAGQVLAIAKANAPTEGAHMILSQMERAVITMDELRHSLSVLLPEPIEGQPPPRIRLRDNEFGRVAEWCKSAGKPHWALRPRTFVVLYMIGHEDALDEFVKEDLSDIALPYTDRNLPRVLKGIARDHFLDCQNDVLTGQAKNLERPGGDHQHIQGDADDYFKIVKPLGSGSSGHVDHVMSRLSLASYARKRISRGRLYVKDKQNIRLFENELVTLKRLSHRHLVFLVGSYTDKICVGLLMTPIANSNMKTYLEATMDEEQTAARKLCLRYFFGCIATAVEYLHENSVRHKDIKPGNILIKDDKVYITDFGISRWTGDASDSTSGTVEFYTRRYSAPEVSSNRGSRDKSSDMWSLGCVYLEMCTVLCGHSIKEMRDFYLANGNKKPFISNNEQATEKWSAELRSRFEDRHDEQPLALAQALCAFNQNSRPTASETVDQISHFKGSRYFGFCCERDYLDIGTQGMVDDDTITQDQTTSSFHAAEVNHDLALLSLNNYHQPTVEDAEMTIRAFFSEPPKDSHNILEDITQENLVLPESERETDMKVLHDEDGLPQDQPPPYTREDRGDVEDAKSQNSDSETVKADNDSAQAEKFGRFSDLPKQFRPPPARVPKPAPKLDTKESPVMAELPADPELDDKTAPPNPNGLPSASLVPSYILASKNRFSREELAGMSPQSKIFSGARTPLFVYGSLMFPSILRTRAENFIGTDGTYSATLRRRLRTNAGDWSEINFSLQEAAERMTPAVLKGYRRGTYPGTTLAVIRPVMPVGTDSDDEAVAGSDESDSSSSDEDNVASSADEEVKVKENSETKKETKEEVEEKVKDEVIGFVVFGLSAEALACLDHFYGEEGPAHLFEGAKPIQRDLTKAPIKPPIGSAKEAFQEFVERAGQSKNVRFEGNTSFRVNSSQSSKDDSNIKDEEDDKTWKSTMLERKTVQVRIGLAGGGSQMIHAETYVPASSRKSSRPYDLDWKGWTVDDFIKCPSFHKLTGDLEGSMWVEEERRLAQWMGIKFILHGDVLSRKVLQKDIDVVRTLLNDGHDPNAPCTTHGFPLHAAAYTGEVEMIDLLIAAGAQVNVTGGRYETPLIAATVNGHEDAVRVLLDRGADLFAHGGSRISAIYQAVNFDDYDMVHLLLERGAWLTKTYRELLDLAAERNNTGIRRELERYDVRDLHLKALTDTEEKSKNEDKTEEEEDDDTSDAGALARQKEGQGSLFQKGASTSMIGALLMEAFQWKGKKGKWTGIKGVSLLRIALQYGASPDILVAIRPWIGSFPRVQEFFQLQIQKFQEERAGRLKDSNDGSSRNLAVPGPGGSGSASTRPRRAISDSGPRRSSRDRAGEDFAKSVCPSCDGRGGRKGTSRRCADCEGCGARWSETKRRFSDSRPCEYCFGTGRVYSSRDVCRTCNGIPHRSYVKV